MPKIIVTSTFRKGGGAGKKGGAGGLLRYMGTREGVEKLPLNQGTKAATKRQQDLIASVVKKIPGTAAYPEYQEFLEQNTRTAATEFLNAVMAKEDQAEGIGKLVTYMAERPGVVKLGKHGLFSQTDKINREKLSLYYENKDPTVPLVENKEFRSIKNTVIKAVMGIPLEPEIQPVEPVPEVSDHIRELYEELLGEPYPDSEDSSNANLPDVDESEPPEVPMKEPTVHQTMAVAGNIIAALAKLIEDKCMTHQRSLEGQIDHRLQSVINEKKQALGLRIERTQKPSYQTEEEYEMSR